MSMDQNTCSEYINFHLTMAHSSRGVEWKDSQANITFGYSYVQAFVFSKPVG